MGRADTHLHTEYSGFNKLGVMKFPESVTQPEKQVDRMRALGMTSWRSRTTTRSPERS